MYTTEPHTSKYILKKVTTPTALILIDGDVVKTYLHADVEFTEESSEENIAAIWNDIKDKKIFNLLVPDASTQITVDVRTYENVGLERIKRAEAIVIKSLAHRLLAKFYLKPRKERYPTKVFDNEAKALEWFDSIRQTEES
ncbi:MAG: hypothetical protein GC178_17235 [Flavobacteriales bacterium]|nr:hypothetical protein [Flavobacteriales bacterium]